MRSTVMQAATAAILAAACAGYSQILINGAGATFPYPIYAKWFDEYHRVRPDATLNYQSVGSAAGVRQLEAGVLDFGASDRPLSDREMDRLGERLLHFPTVVGAVVPIYNLPKVSRTLNLTPRALAGILLGKVTRWNDPLLAEVNPGVRLPDADLIPVHRSDGSGTTYILSEFLSKTDDEWKRDMGVGAALRWRVGIGARGNEGVAGIVKQTPYSLGYAELVYAAHNRVAYARVRNAAGRFVQADVASIRAAAATVANSMPEDFRVSITNAPRKDAYPMASYTWLLTSARIQDPAKRRMITDFLRWMLDRGQAMAEPLGYAPLPEPVAAKALKACDRIR